MLDALRLKNYKLHEGKHVSFDEGINLVVAPNGSGKTKLVESLDWVLHGSEGLPGNMDSVLRRVDGEVVADETEVEAILTIHGKLHTFYRKYDGSSEAGVMVEGEVISNTPSGVSEYLDSIGIDRDGYSMIYAQQKELDYFVHAIPSIRKKLLTNLLNLDRLDVAYSDIRSKLTDLREYLQDDPDDADIEEVEDRINANLNQASYLEHKLEGKKDRKEKLQEEVSDLRGKVVDAGSMDALLDRREKLELRLEDIEDRCDKVEQERDPLYLICEPEDDLSVLDEKIEEQREVVTKVREQIASDTHMISERQDAIDKLKDSRQCPVCLSEVDPEVVVEEFSSEVQGRKDRVQKLKEQYGQEKESLNSLVDKKNSVRKQWDNFSKAQERIQVLDDELDKLEDDFDETSSKLGDVSDEIASLPDADETQQYLDEKEEELDSLRDSIAEDKAFIDSLQKEAEALEEQKHGLLKLKDEMEEVREDLQVVSDLKSEFPQFRDFFISDSLGWVCGRATSILYSVKEEMWEVTCDQDLNFFVNGMPLVEYSAGEVDLVCICLRVAISEFLSKRIGIEGMMILDGVFDRIDDDNRDCIGQLVEEISVPQIIILSHFDVPVLQAREIRI